MYTNNTCLVFIVLCLSMVNLVYTDCKLNLKTDFATPAPVLIRYNDYVSPDTSDAILLKRSETLLVACPGDKRHLVLKNTTSSYSVLEASCINNSTFRLDRWIGEFGHVRCNSQPSVTVAETAIKCHHSAKIYRFGYTVKSKLYPLYEACFDKDLLATYYVRHQLTPTSVLVQNDKRPKFNEGGLFKKVRMDELYKMENQKRRISEIVGANNWQNYLSNKQLITRGHMAARADFALLAPSRATFQYANTAPQWLRGNAGDWAALEDALRRRVRRLGRPVTVYTGAHGVMTLPDPAGRTRELYLAVDANNNGLVPVPMYFYKVVYDPQTKSAVTFVSINSSFYNSTMINKLEFCEDVCEGNTNYSWLTWRPRDGTHSFCCNYEDFIKKIDYLDKLNVKKMFY